MAADMVMWTLGWINRWQLASKQMFLYFAEHPIL